MEYKVEAVVLSSREIKEFDRIYSILSREKGRIKIMAKGVRKPQAKLSSALEPVTKSEIFLVRGRVMDKVAGAIVCDQYHQIKKSLEITLMVRRLFDLAERLLAEGEPAENFYDELVFFLENANKVKEDKLHLMQLALIWKMLREGGYQARIYHCGSCGKKLQSSRHYWFLPEVGVICSDCQTQVGGNKSAVDEETIKILRIFSQKDLKVISKLAVSLATLRNFFTLTKILLENMLQRKVEL